MKKKILPDVKDGRRKSKGRPESVDKRPRQAMFSVQGSSGWRRRRDIRNHKGTGMKEDNFSDQHHKFTEEEA
jgi:hypothetical protein